VLRPLHDHPATRSPDVLVGPGDDAGVYRLADGRVLIQTVDFFTPIVDDPYDWGRIAAANALSDVYAMGGSPLTALQLVGWPRGEIPLAALEEVIRGGADVMAEGGCVIVGGHSIDDREPKYGFAVTGTVASVEELVTNAGGRPGDRLVLTKPLGLGIIATAVKAGACPPEVAAEAVETMVALNDRAARAMHRVGAHAATDVTGFGLLGHLREILVASGLSAVVDAEAVPVLPGVVELLGAGFWPGGSGRNLDSVRPHVLDDPAEATLQILCDAQTSGGLLMAVPPDREGALLGALEEEGVAAAVIGELTDGPEATIRLC